MWNKTQLLITSAILSSAMALPAIAGDAVNAKFDKGYFKFGSESGNFKMKLDGRIMLDAKSFSEHEGERLISSNADFRRARLAFKTEFYQDWAGEFDIDFKNNKTKVKDMWVSYKAYENGKIKVGNQKPLFSMAEVTTSRWYPLMETSSISDFTHPGRRIGVTLDYWNESFFVGASIFGEETKANDKKDDLEDEMLADGLSDYLEDFSEAVGDGEGKEWVDENGTWKDVAGDIEDEAAGWATAQERTSYSARAVYRPIINDDQSRFVHVGASILRDSPFAEDQDYVKVKGEVHDVAFLYQKLKPWKGLHVNDRTAYGLELAARYDKIYFQSEYISNTFDFKTTGADDIDNDFDVDGFYVEASYFILGPGRSYNLHDGEFGPVVPKVGQPQLEVIVRYDEMDMNNPGAIYTDNKGKEKDFMSGKSETLTIGVNYYVNSNVILRANYINVQTDDNAKIDNADVDIFAARLEFLF